MNLLASNMNNIIFAWSMHMGRRLFELRFMVRGDIAHL